MHQEFFQAILDHPDDDELRLVFADWLDEQGDPRGEFIRLQIMLAQLDEDDPRRLVVVDRLLEFDHLRRPDWQPPPRSGIRWGNLKRGLVQDVTIDVWEGFLAHAHELFQLAPIRTLHLRFPIEIDEMEQFAAWEGLRRLKALHISFNQLGDLGTEILVRSPYLDRLLLLDLRDNRIFEAGGRAIAASPYLQSLRILDLRDNRLRDNGTIALSLSPYLKSLIDLNLIENQIGDAGAEALAASPYLGGVQSLKLADNRIFVGGIEALRARFGDAVFI